MADKQAAFIISKDMSNTKPMHPSHFSRNEWREQPLVNFVDYFCNVIEAPPTAANTFMNLLPIGACTVPKVQVIDKEVMKENFDKCGWGDKELDTFRSLLFVHEGEDKQDFPQRQEQVEVAFEAPRGRSRGGYRQRIAGSMESCRCSEKYLNDYRLPKELYTQELNTFTTHNEEQVFIARIIQEIRNVGGDLYSEQVVGTIIDKVEEKHGRVPAWPLVAPLYPAPPQRLA